MCTTAKNKLNSFIKLERIILLPGICKLKTSFHSENFYERKFYISMVIQLLILRKATYKIRTNSYPPYRGETSPLVLKVKG